MHTASKISVRTITMTALLSAIAYILAFAEFPVRCLLLLPEWIFPIFRL